MYTIILVWEHTRGESWLYCGVGMWGARGEGGKRAHTKHRQNFLARHVTMPVEPHNLTFPLLFSTCRLLTPRDSTIMSCELLLPTRILRIDPLFRSRYGSWPNFLWNKLRTVCTRNSSDVLAVVLPLDFSIWLLLANRLYLNVSFHIFVQQPH